VGGEGGEGRSEAGEGERAFSGKLDATSGTVQLFLEADGIVGAFRFRGLLVHGKGRIIAKYKIHWM
jgi:hypothetical protein